MNVTDYAAAGPSRQHPSTFCASHRDPAMTLALRTAATPTTDRTPAGDRTSHRHRIGDRVEELAATYAARMNALPFSTELRAGRIDREAYRVFITTFYPVVIGFNRALIRGIAKVDHVRHASFVKVLAEQLQEEQAHNQLWRVMLEIFGIDHETLYGDVADYLARFTTDELNAMTAEVLADCTRDGRRSARRVFPDGVLPDAVLALYHHLWMTASDERIDHWEHFASQAGMEMVIYAVVSASILPGVMGNRDLDLGEGTTHWWREHGKEPGIESVGRSDEEKHLELSRIALNRSETANALADRVAARAEDTMRLFAATLEAQEAAVRDFAIARYLKQ
jgi:hypothetical protein